MKMYENGYPYYGLMMLNLADAPRTTTLAEVVKGLRAQHKMTQKQFAEHVQAYSVQHGTKFGGKYGDKLVSAYERQKCSPKLDNMIAICKAFNVNPLLLCGYDPGNSEEMPTIFKTENRNEAIDFLKNNHRPSLTAVDRPAA